MIPMAAQFAAIAARLSSQFGGPYHRATAIWQDAPVFDSGGSIVTPGAVVSFPCLCQVDGVTESMRRSESYTEKDMRLLILREGLGRAIDSGATVDVLTGPHAGRWLVASVTADAAGVYYECTGRRA
jgi:hypothetical protein